jgi:hypothetical protein
MRIADLTSGAARLRDQTDVLVAAWGETRDHWNDANSRNIDENHLNPLAEDVSAALTAIRHLSEVLAKAQRECESW